MDAREELQALRRLAELEAKAGVTSAPASSPAAPMSAGDQFKAGLSNFVGKDLVMGAVRGAAGIGATIMQPFQALEDKLTGRTDPTLSTLITGQRPQSSNEATRAGIEGGVRTTGADPSSLAFQAGKIGTEIAGTAGVGGALAAPLRGVAPGLANALASGGMQAGQVAPNALARAAGMGTRMVGGGVTGAASAGLVDPSSATAGGVIGAALPPALRVAGAAGQAVGRVLRGPEQAPEVAAAVQAARESGYVIPPTQARPTLANRLMEGAAGKITTAQNASARNQAVTNAKAAESIGLSPDTKITPEVLADLRKTAGQAYDAVAQAGQFRTQPSYDAALDAIVDPYLKAAKSFPGAKINPIVENVEALRTPLMDSASAVAKIKELRAAADTAYGQQNKEVGKALKSAADALEQAIDGHLVASGAPADLLNNYRAARTQIAKTYSVEKALNAETGSVDARKLASQLQRGKPLTAGLKEAASFASRFPKAAQTPEAMGSLPGTSPLDWTAGAAMSLGTGNPLGMLGVAARPAARAATLSPFIQNRLIQAAQNPADLNALRALTYRGAPLIGTDQ